MVRWFGVLFPQQNLSFLCINILQISYISIVSIGAFQVLQLVREAGLKADCKLYTTLISTCAKSGKVDAMFEVCLFPCQFVIV